MRVSRFEIEPARLGLREPLQTARGTVRERAVWILSLEDDSGRVGLGEVAPLAFAGTEPADDVPAALEAVRSAILAGEVPLEGGAWEADLVRLLPTCPATRAGVDLALWDLAGRRARKPLAELLNRDASPLVPVHRLLAGSEVGRAAREAVEAGITTLKIKVGAASAQSDSERLAQVRSAVAGRARLRLDANGAWPDAVVALEALELLGLEDVVLVEQPVPAEDHEGLAQLRAALSVAVAADESATSEAVCRGLLESESADVLVLKPVRLGGLGPCLRVAEAARLRGAGVYVTTMLGGAISRAGALHLACAVGADLPHGLASGSLLTEDLATGHDESGPTLGPGSRVGLGVERR